MDSDDLEDDKDFRKAVEEIIEDCEVDEDGDEGDHGEGGFRGGAELRLRRSGGRIHWGGLVPGGESRPRDWRQRHRHVLRPAGRADATTPHKLSWGVA